MRVVVTGSLAYDYIMDFPGFFKDHILPEKVHVISVSFLVDSMQKMRGGVAGNIAYTLALLGQRPTIVGSAGHDFADYREWLHRHGIDTSGIVAHDDVFTASCFITTDQSDNQIVAFYPGAMARSGELSLRTLGLGADDLVLISPSDSHSMHLLAQECQELGVPYLFDPGKQTPRLEAEHIRHGLRGARILVGNDYEYGMMAKKLGISEQELIASAPLTFVTRGEEGSMIYDNQTNQTLTIPIAPVNTMVDPTGAGDAFLGGLVAAYARGLPLETIGRIAALAATYAIEQRGCQEHHYTLDAFAARYQEIFGTGDGLQSLAG